MSRNLRAFTLLELMVTISLVAVLLTLVIVPLHSVRQAANRTNSLNGLKQMVLAYSAYSTDHRYQLMPGFLGETLLSEFKITAELPDGTLLADPAYCAPGICDASSYVWRLAPYLDDVWKTMYVDYRSKALLSQLEVESWCGIYGSGTLSTPCQELAQLELTPIGIGRAPSFGMNSIFVGGDSFHGGPEVMDHNPWTGSEEKLAATRFSEVKNPAKLIVFGTAALANDSGFAGDPDTDEVYDSEERLGYVELRAPFTVFDAATETWSNQQWAVGKHLEVIRTTTGDYGARTGLPVSRWGANLLPVANLDGSTGVEDTSTLAVDMRRWSPFAFGMNVPAFDP